jgi:hypothetical protein
MRSGVTQQQRKSVFCALDLCKVVIKQANSEASSSGFRVRGSWQEEELTVRDSRGKFVVEEEVGL